MLGGELYRPCGSPIHDGLGGMGLWSIARVAVGLRRLRAERGWAVITAAAVAAGPALAQPAGGVVPSEPSRAVDPSPTPIPAAPDLGAAPVPAPSPGPAPGEQRFLIQGYDVVGNTLIEQAVVERTVYPFLGPERSKDDVERARQALENVYRARGFQSVAVAYGGATDDNYVTLTVTEARIGRVRVIGAKWYSPRSVLDQLPEFREGRIANFTQAQRDIAGLERTGADRRVSVTIPPNPRIPGTVDVDLQVEDKLPLHASVTVSNDHSPNTMPLRVLANVRATNLWQLGHTASFSYLVAPQRRTDAEVYAGSYLAPIHGSRWSLLVYGYRSNSNVALLGGASVLGQGYAIGTRALLALGSTASWNHSLNFGADFKDFIQDTTIPGAVLGTTEVVRAPVRYVPATFAYQTQRGGERTTFTAGVSLTAGLRAFDDVVDIGQPDVFGNPVFAPTFANAGGSFGSRENFVHANLDIEWTYTAKNDASINLKFNGQLADSRLITNEQFSAGGIASVRGYLQSEAVGDDGASGQIEVRTPNYNGFASKYVRNLRGFGFIDAGYVRLRDAGAGVINEYTIVGTGAGLRASLFGVLTGDLFFAAPLADGSFTKVGDLDVWFNVKAEF